MNFPAAAPGTGSGRAQAARWLETAEKLLAARDLVGCKRFADLALETDPLLPGADELLAVADVLLASQTTLPSGQANPLAILQLPTGVNPDQAAVSRAFRHLALLLGPGNTHPGRELALRLVNDAHALLSDPSRRPTPSAGSITAGAGNSSQPAAAADPHEFWTACPFCCYVHQYPRDLVGRALKCPNEGCRRGFVAVEIPTPPTVVPGTEMYHCVWGFFPLGLPNAADLGGNSKPFYKAFPWNMAPSGEGAGGRSHGNHGGSYSRQTNNGSARGGSSRGRVKKTTARKKVGAGFKRRSFGGGVESGIDSSMLGQDGWAGGEDCEDGREEEVRGININEAAQATDGTGRVNVSGASGVEDMGSFHIDVVPTEDILGNLHNMPFLRVDNLGRML